MLSGTLFSLWAVHISDFILITPWWVAGWVLAGLFMLLGAWRLREEEIPRVALLTAAFFIVSWPHVPVGPAGAHLLLTGLMGVVLGWRVGLAIPLAVALQAILLGHGGYTTIGINSCVMIVPALLAGWLFRGLAGRSWIHRRGFRTTIIVVSSLTWSFSLVYSVTLLVTGDFDSANELTFHPATVGIILLVAAVIAWGEWEVKSGPLFALGFFIGELAVLTTVALHVFVLLEGGHSNWTIPALLEVVFHLPLAVVEGIVVGFTVGFLARVKPEMLGPSPIIRHSSLADTGASSPMSNGQGPRRDPVSSLLLSILVLLVLGLPARAHRLEGEYKVLPGQKIRIESWFDLGGASPTEAVVQVFGSDGKLREEGKLNDRGIFVFSYDRAEPLRVVILAGGHRKELEIPRRALADSSQGDLDSADPSPAAVEPPLADRQSRVQIKDILIGVGFVLALAAFILSWRNAIALRSLKNR
jgi:cobalt/nickel transport system permease protein